MSSVTRMMLILRHPQAMRWLATRGTRHIGTCARDSVAGVHRNLHMLKYVGHYVYPPTGINPHKTPRMSKCPLAAITAHVTRG